MPYWGVMAALTQPMPKPIDLRSPEAGRVALKGFFGITQDWKLTGKEQQALLGDIARPTLDKYRKAPPTRLSRDQVDRISYIFGIHKALMIHFGDIEYIADWIRRPNNNAPFYGQSMLSYMIDHGLVGLAETRRHLDAWRG